VHLLEGYKGDTFMLPALNNRVEACYDLLSKRKLPFRVNADKTIAVKDINRKESKYDTVIEVVYKKGVE
jgi:hypothetical protein